MYLERRIIDRSIFGGCGGGGNGKGYFDCNRGLGSAGFGWVATLELYAVTLAIAPVFCTISETGAGTSVSRDVLPEPLGPTRRTEGRVVAEADRYMTKWRKSGIDRTTNMVIRMAEGVGCSNEVSQL